MQRKMRAAFGFGGVVEPGMCGHLFAGIGISVSFSLNKRTTVKDNIRTIGTAAEESDDNIVPEKPANKRDVFSGVGRGKCIGQEELEAERHEPDTRPGFCVERSATCASKEFLTPLLEVGAVCGNSARTDLYGGSG